jgi:hypothetical protein
VNNRGKPLLSKSDDDRCEALTVMTTWKIERKKDQRCPFKAKMLVDEHQFCSHHARKEAVAICLEKGYIKRIFIPHAQFGERVHVVTKEVKK